MKIIVKYLKTQEEYTVNPDVENIYLDAAKQAMKALRSRPDTAVTVLLQCWLKKTPKEIHHVNTYFALLAADMNNEAEKLRDKFMEQFGIDVSTEQINN